MDAEKIRNLTDDELRHQEHELNDQLFRLKFQLNMGQTESLKKIRGLRKDIARVKTIARQRHLAGGASGPARSGKKAAPARTEKTMEKK
jgi:large subunit ribosomal protein L29